MESRASGSVSPADDVERRDDPSPPTVRSVVEQPPPRTAAEATQDTRGGTRTSCRCSEEGSRLAVSVTDGARRTRSLVDSSDVVWALRRGRLRRQGGRRARTRRASSVGWPSPRSRSLPGTLLHAGEGRTRPIRSMGPHAASPNVPPGEARRMTLGWAELVPAARGERNEGGCAASTMRRLPNKSRRDGQYGEVATAERWGTAGRTHSELRRRAGSSSRPEEAENASRVREPPGGGGGGTEGTRTGAA
ncbi:hypothetical protein THAOC_09294 [Thalassiosira oceanica]|uniref:Uncharacterized protein n=1 Tax=Thalassiosira oceanica TaxID=159749 RepID=K0SSW1_THAOC|nr:hypothetical protein THAOC_09294 [Thalassiosira oceanica]|eukprot:EJK69448.1 hypothetical protein THAOC_09294 [Thalassiosira oceanica]